MKLEAKTVMQLLGIATIIGSGAYNNVAGLFAGFKFIAKRRSEMKHTGY